MFKKFKKSYIPIAVILAALIGFGGFTTARLVRIDILAASASSDFGGEIITSAKNVPDDFEELVPRYLPLNKILYYLSGLINSNQVMLGKDEWLFYSSKINGSPIDDYTGANSYTEQDMEEMKTVAENVGDTLKKKDIGFCLLVPPNKPAVYSEYMPISSIKADKSRTDLLMEYLAENGINAVNPKQDLRQFGDKYYTYFKRDTHWNELGAYIGCKDVLDTFGIALPDLTDDMISVGNRASADLVKLAGLDNVFKPDYGFTVNYVISDGTTIEKDMQHFHNDNADNDKTLLIIGDSFRSAMIPTLRAAFRDVYAVNRAVYESGDYLDCNPDYVILEFVERHSDLIKDFEL